MLGPVGLATRDQLGPLHFRPNLSFFVLTEICQNWVCFSEVAQASNVVNAIPL